MRLLRNLIFWLAFAGMVWFDYWLLDPNRGQPAYDPQPATLPVHDTLLQT